MQKTRRGRSRSSPRLLREFQTLIEQVAARAGMIPRSATMQCSLYGYLVCLFFWDHANSGCGPNEPHDPKQEPNMANRKNKPSHSKPRDLHPGSSVEDAKEIGGKADFGVPASNVAERSYTSRNTKRSDPGAAPPRSGSEDSRTSGAGGNSSGPGSSSGGDLNPDIIGIATGSGVFAASGKIHEPSGPDDATGTSRDFASGPPAHGAKPSSTEVQVHGSTVPLRLMMPHPRSSGRRCRVASLAGR